MKKSDTSTLMILLGVFSHVFACSTGISGIVLNIEERPIYSPHARVNIVHLSGKDSTGESQIVKLSEDGTFSNEEKLSPGEYLIESLVPGYHLKSIRANLEDDVHLKIKMQAIEKSKLNSIGANMDVNLDRGAGKTNLTPPAF